jgi:hypothetical protein
MKSVKMGETGEGRSCDFVAVVARGAGGWRKEWWGWGIGYGFLFSRLRAAGWLLLAGSWVSLEGRLPCVRG